MTPEELCAALTDAGADRADRAEYAVRGIHVDALVPATALRGVVGLLREDDFLLESVSGLDAAPELMVVYHFHLLQGGLRVCLRVLTDRDDPRVPSIHDLFHGANWHEREQDDLYGIRFEGHPDPTPLILPEDAGDLNPLRKKDKRLKGLDALLPEFAPPPADEPPAGDAP